MYFTSGSSRAFESLMQGKPGFERYDSGSTGVYEDCGACRFYRPHWKYQFCVYAECPYMPGRLTALPAVKSTVKGVDDEMAVFRVEKNKGYTLPPFNKGLGLSQQANDPGPAGCRGGLFSGVWLHSLCLLRYLLTTYYNGRTKNAKQSA